MASFGFFFLPLLELKPNRLASGISFYLLELEGDYRYLVLFGLAILPAFIAFQAERLRRGWLLALAGCLLLFLTLLLPANAGRLLVENAAGILGDGVMLRNPRVLPAAAMALGLVGGYVVLFAGLHDLRQMGVSLMQRGGIMAASLLLLLAVLASGQADIYSVIIEYRTNGALLGQRFLEHLSFVLVALAAGTMTGIGLGLWASRSAQAARPVLYIAGIIQTIPSLALFGIMLVPLARLGDQKAGALLAFTLVTGLLAVTLLWLYGAPPLPLPGRSILLAAGGLTAGVALFPLLVVVISFAFQVVKTALTTERYQTANSQAAALVLLLAGTMLVRLHSRRSRRLLAGGRMVAALVLAGLVFPVIAQSAQQIIGRTPLADLTVRDLGVSGIGTAPALIALTLYALLPLVRNTYAGLRSVDPALIDSAAGMGMTARQIFFRVELPVAFPIMMAGVRSAGIALVGIGAIASVIGGGGLGDFIIQGIVNTSIDMILLGAIPAVLLALLLDALLRALEITLTSPGIRYSDRQSG